MTDQPIDTTRLIRDVIAVENLSKIEMLSTGPTLLNWQDFQ